MLQMADSERVVGSPTLADGLLLALGILDPENSGP